MGKQNVGQSWLVGPGRLLCSSCELQELQTASPAGLRLSSTAAREQLAGTQHSSGGTGQLYSLLCGERREKLLEHSVSLQYRRENLMCRVHSVPLQFITWGFDSPALFLSNCGCFTVSCRCSGTASSGSGDGVKPDIVDSVSIISIMHFLKKCLFLLQLTGN